MQTLGFDIFTRTEPASNLFIELVSRNDIYFVRFLHLRHAFADPIVKEMRYEEFQDHISNVYSDFRNIFGNESIEEICNLDYVAFLTKAENEQKTFKLSDSHNFLEKLTAAHGVEDIYRKFQRELEDRRITEQENEKIRQVEKEAHDADHELEKHAKHMTPSIDEEELPKEIQSQKEDL